MNITDLQKFTHILFDYDGLIVDSEKLYFETWSLLLTDQGKEVCKNFHEGKHESEVYEKVREFLLNPMSLEEVSNYRASLYWNLVAKGRLELMDGIKELLEVLKSTNTLSIVSNSTIDVVKEGLGSTNLTEYFENLFCYSTDLQRKPSPDLYNKALLELDQKNDSVIALEDSQSGILAAKAAGIQVICINPNNRIFQFCINNDVPYLRSAFDLLR